MARILFRLRMVPEDEAQEVRELLTERHIPWYETCAGRWGVSFPALWVREDDDLPRARELLAAYQQERQIRIRAEQRQEAERGETETVLSRLMQRPVQVIGIIVVITIIMYFSISPFFSLIAS